jgi:predicted alpha/beta-fold hydrolase
MSSPEFYPKDFKLDQSAKDFLRRIDAVEEVTLEHHIWYKRHPDDRFTTIDELKDEIALQGERSPLRNDSKSGTLRELAAKSDQQRKDSFEKRGQIWKMGFNIDMVYPYLLSRWRLIRQVFRLPILIITILFTCYIHFRYNNPDSLQSLKLSFPPLPICFIPFILLPFLIICAILQAHTLFFQDVIFYRAWFSGALRTKEGIFVHPTDKHTQSILTRMPILHEKETYPFGWGTGDFQTLLPALLWDNIDLRLPYIRRYIRNLEDDECSAADICFPRDENGVLYFDSTKSVIVFHHGLNGSSHASYMQAHIDYYTKRGHTCIGFNVRGFGGTFICFGKIFVGSRVTDLHFTIMLAHIGAGNNTLDNLISHTRKQPHTLRDSEPQLLNFSTVFKNCQTPMNIVDFPGLARTPICVVGFSMGGIITSNYCTLYGKYAGVQAAFCVCAIGDRNGHDNFYAERDWEMILNDTLKSFITRVEPLLYCEQYCPDFGDGIKRHLDVIGLSKCQTIRDFDSIFTCTAHGVETWRHYYNDLSFGIHLKLENLRTKLFILHPANDPVVSVENMYPITQALLPEHQQDDEFIPKRHLYYTNPNNVKNLTLYIPHNGGHVSSFKKWNDQWAHLCEVSAQYFESVRIEFENNLINPNHEIVGQNQIEFSNAHQQINSLPSTRRKTYHTGFENPNTIIYRPNYRQYSYHMTEVLNQQQELEMGFKGNNGDTGQSSQPQTSTKSTIMKTPTSRRKTVITIEEGDSEGDEDSNREDMVPNVRAKSTLRA